MSRHTTYRGVSIDMDSLYRENSKTPALGNMKVNANGDKISADGVIIKTADQIARENHRVKTAVIHTGLKGDMPDTTGITEDLQKVEKIEKKQPVKPTASKKIEKELPSGDIIVGGNTDEY